MSTDKQILLAVKILGFLKENYGRGLTVEEINRIYVKDRYTSQWEIQEVLEGLEAEKFVEKRSSIITKGETSKSVIMYDITGNGMDRYILLRESSPKVQRAREYQQDYEYEEAQRKKSNKRWFIGCIVGTVLALTIAIIVAISLG